MRVTRSRRRRNQLFPTMPKSSKKRSRRAAFAPIDLNIARRSNDAPHDRDGSPPRVAARSTTTFRIVPESVLMKEKLRVETMPSDDRAAMRGLRKQLTSKLELEPKFEPKKNIKVPEFKQLLDARYYIDTNDKALQQKPWLTPSEWCRFCVHFEQICTATSLSEIPKETLENFSNLLYRYCPDLDHNSKLPSLDELKRIGARLQEEGRIVFPKALCEAQQVTAPEDSSKMEVESEQEPSNPESISDTVAMEIDDEEPQGQESVVPDALQAGALEEWYDKKFQSNARQEISSNSSEQPIYREPAPQENPRVQQDQAPPASPPPTSGTTNAGDNGGIGSTSSPGFGRCFGFVKDRMKPYIPDMARVIHKQCKKYIDVQGASCCSNCSNCRKGIRQRTVPAIFDQPGDLKTLEDIQRANTRPMSYWTEILQNTLVDCQNHLELFETDPRVQYVVQHVRMQYPGKTSIRLESRTKHVFLNLCYECDQVWLSSTENQGSCCCPKCENDYDQQSHNAKKEADKLSKQEKRRRQNPENFSKTNTRTPLIHLRKDELIAMVKELRKEKAILEANNKVLELEKKMREDEGEMMEIPADSPLLDIAENFSKIIEKDKEEAKGGKLSDDSVLKALIQAHLKSTLEDSEDVNFDDIDPTRVQSMAELLASRGRNFVKDLEGKKTQFRYHKLEWDMALSCYRNSPKAYRAGTAVDLGQQPSESGLNKKKAETKVHPGRCTVIYMFGASRRLFECGRKHGDVLPWLQGKLMCDEMYLKGGMLFNSKTHKVVGFIAEMDNMESVLKTYMDGEERAHDKAKIATRVNQWAFRPYTGERLQLLEFFYNDGHLPGDQLLYQFLHVLKNCENFKLMVSGLILDAGGGNQGLFALLKNRFGNTEIDPHQCILEPDHKGIYIRHPRFPRTRKLFLSYCGTHNVKNVRGGLYNSNHFESVQGERFGFGESRLLGQRMYEDETVLRTKLTQEVLYLTNHSKMSVKLVKDWVDDGNLAYDFDFTCDLLGLDKATKEKIHRDAMADKTPHLLLWLNRKDTGSDDSEDSEDGKICIGKFFALAKHLRKHVESVQKEHPDKPFEAAALSHLAHFEFYATCHDLFLEIVLNTSLRIFPGEDGNLEKIKGFLCHRMGFIAKWEESTKGQDGRALAKVTWKNFLLSVSSMLAEADYIVDFDEKNGKLNILDPNRKRIRYFSIAFGNTSCLENVYSIMRFSGCNDAQTYATGVANYIQKPLTQKQLEMATAKSKQYDKDNSCVSASNFDFAAQEKLEEKLKKDSESYIAKCTKNLEKLSKFIVEENRDDEEENPGTHLPIKHYMDFRIPGESTLSAQFRTLARDFYDPKREAKLSILSKSESFREDLYAASITDHTCRPAVEYLANMDDFQALNFEAAMQPLAEEILRIRAQSINHVLDPKHKDRCFSRVIMGLTHDMMTERYDHPIYSHMRRTLRGIPDEDEERVVDWLFPLLVDAFAEVTSSFLLTFLLEKSYKKSKLAAEAKGAKTSTTQIQRICGWAIHSLQQQLDQSTTKAQILKVMIHFEVDVDKNQKYMEENVDFVLQVLNKGGLSLLNAQVIPIFKKMVLQFQDRTDDEEWHRHGSETLQAAHSLHEEDKELMQEFLQALRSLCQSANVDFKEADLESVYWAVSEKVFNCIAGGVTKEFKESLLKDQAKMDVVGLAFRSFLKAISGPNTSTPMEIEAEFEAGEARAESDMSEKEKHLLHFEVALKNLKNKELSDKLKERNLPYSGTKDKLIARLVENEGTKYDDEHSAPEGTNPQDFEDQAEASLTMPMESVARPAASSVPLSEGEGAVAISSSGVVDTVNSPAPPAAPIVPAPTQVPIRPSKPIYNPYAKKN